MINNDTMAMNSHQASISQTLTLEECRVMQSAHLEGTGN